MKIKKNRKMDNKLNWNKIFIYLLFLILFLIFIIFIIVNQIKEYYSQMDPMLDKIKDKLLTLHPVVNRIKFYQGDKSYTINKKKIYLCLKDENNQYYDFNMLIYVSIHELAHVLCDEIGHTSKFNNIFQDLLRKAAFLNIYNPNKPIITNYCGHS